jgi:peptidoglycan-associated lipoprotein
MATICALLNLIEERRTMLLRTKLMVAMTVALGFVGCNNEKKPEEPATPSSTEEPATPPSAEVPPPSSDVAPQTIYFAFDDYTLNAEAQSKLTTLADALKASKTVAIQIEGHCDERGTTEYNLALGERRANAVKNFLSQLGVEGARLSAISYGEEKPAAQGHTEDAWSQNRRAEFSITSK